MNETFRKYVEALHPAFERLLAMLPVTIASLPKDAPLQGIYLFSEKGQFLYVGRTMRQSLRQRLRQHSIDSAQHNQAVFAFKIAREVTGHLHPGYTATDSRKARCADPQFAKAFLEAKRRIRVMELRYIDESDALRQTLLEICVAVALRTPYNDFDTH